jgi:hypothetical protein
MKLTNFLKLVAVILIALGSAAGGPKIRAEWADIRTWHVAPLGSDITGDGTEGSPFALAIPCWCIPAHTPKT